MNSGTPKYFLNSNIPDKRQYLPCVAPQDRIKSFQEVEQGMEAAAAILESKRCLSCRKCIGCGLCLAVCDKNAIIFQDSEEELELEFDAIILTPEVNKFSFTPHAKCGQGNYDNLITADVFERVLGNTGPHGEYLLRASDGDIPRRIAFIIDLPNGGESLFPELCYYARRIALAAKERIDGLEIWIFCPPSSALVSKRTDEADSKEAWYTEKAVGIISATELEPSKDLKITYREDDTKKEEIFELVVLIDGFRFSETTRMLFDSLGLDIVASRYIETGDDTLIKTDTQNIYLAGYEFEQ